ncbi:MAG: HAD-IIA family hydrolase [Elusimicrobiota bacterium]|nr:HAD-IIA family hydrolase [Elusimicrobiota bacterium]
MRDEIRYDLMQIPNEKILRERLKKIKHFALDMDGTIYIDLHIFDWTIPFLSFLKSSKIGYTFLTNNPTKSLADYLKHLRQMGIFATKDELSTSVGATINYLRFNHPNVKKLFLLATESMISEFEQEGFISTSNSVEDKPDALIVSFDSSLKYDRLCRAAWWAKQGIFYIATNPDRVCPTNLPTVLVDCGSICASIEYATNKKPDFVVGKPNPQMIEALIQKHNLKRDEIAMVGDRIYTDIQMAKNANVLSILVLSGEACPEDVMKAPFKPDIVVKNLFSLVELIKN